MSVVVLDTDVASALLRRRTSRTLSEALAGRIPAITFVTVGELTKWTLVRELPLATFNTRDYLDFAEHEGLDLLATT